MTLEKNPDEVSDEDYLKMVAYRALRRYIGGHSKGSGARRREVEAALKKQSKETKR